MCLILVAYKKKPPYKLILAANRDEFYQRKTAPMHFWPKDNFILAGRDLERGGTWLGISKNKRLAALTNYREPSLAETEAPSRGKIVTDYLETKEPTAHFLEKLEKKADLFNGFNVILGDMENLFWYSNRNNLSKKLVPGLYGLSNSLLDTPWPKVTLGKACFKEAVEKSGTIHPSRLFSILENEDRPDDQRLPDTGVGLKTERMLSPLFIKSENYGTRCSTVITVDEKTRVNVWERTYHRGDKENYKEMHFIVK